MMERSICPWAKGDLYIAYHDHEWGRPCHEDQKLFEMLILEGMQAGLSWITILKKREAFREAFDGFDPEMVARYGDDKLEELMGNAQIVRNRRKLQAAVGNACAFLEVQKEYGSFDRYLWGFVGGIPVRNHWERMEDLPARTEISDRMSADLKKKGFRFVGSTICYAFMQSVGMVNDHFIWCDQYHTVSDPAGTASKSSDAC